MENIPVENGNVSFYVYESYLELWNVFDTQFPEKQTTTDNIFISLDDEKSNQTQAINGNNYSNKTPIYHGQNQGFPLVKRISAQSIVLAFLGCVVALFLLFQLILYSKQRFVKKNSWSVATSEKTILTPVVKSEDTVIWSSIYGNRFKTMPYRHSGLTFAPHHFQTHGYCTIPGSMNLYTSQASGRASKSSSSSSRIAGSLAHWNQIGRFPGTEFEETTVFMVDPRGHFTSRLAATTTAAATSDLLNLSDSPSYESCMTCRSNNSEVHSPSRVVITKKSTNNFPFNIGSILGLGTKYVTNRQNSNSSSYSIGPKSRCEGCGTSLSSSLSKKLSGASTTTSGDSLSYYRAGVSLLPVTSHVDLPMSIEKASLTTVSSLSADSECDTKAFIGTSSAKVVNEK